MTQAMNATVGDPTLKLVLMGYANHAHADGTGAWPAVATIARYAECSPRTVQRAIRALVDRGFLTVGDQRMVAHLRADRRPTVYDLTFPTAGENPVDNTTERGDSLSPRVPHGVTPEAPRGDTGDAHGVTQLCHPNRHKNHPEGGADDPRRCAAHSRVTDPPPCGNCRERRRAADAADELATKDPRTRRGFHDQPCPIHPDQIVPCGRCAHAAVNSDPAAIADAKARARAAARRHRPTTEEPVS